MAKEIRLLRANEIECRVGTANANGFSLLLYKDARVDMNILDEVYGNMNWQREHKEIKGNLYCGVSIWDEEKKQWVTKWDCGVESNTEKEKGESSDSFKRACFNLGIGRELYTAPFIWVKGNVKDKNGKYVPTFNNMEVKYIAYNDNREIAHLIINGDGKTIFGYNEPKTFNDNDKTFTPDEIKEIHNNTPVVVEKPVKEEKIEQLAIEEEPKPVKKEKYKYELTLEEAENTTTPRGARLGDLSYDQLQVIMKNDKYDLHIKACAAKIIKNLEEYAFEEETDGGNLEF